MRHFVYRGNSKQRISPPFDDISFLYRGQDSVAVSMRDVKQSLSVLINKNSRDFVGKKICLVIPDNTRNGHQKKIVSLIGSLLSKTCAHLQCVVALGLHKKVSSSVLSMLIGRNNLKRLDIVQHDLADVSFVGKIRRVPAYFNRCLFDCDTIVTLGVVEPHGLRVP